MRFAFTRLVFGYLLALPVVTPYVSGAIGGEQGHTLVLRMSARATGLLQVFFDISGGGYSEQYSAGTQLLPSSETVEYRFALPPATYRSIRIDPAEGAGVFTIERATIVALDGSLEVNIPVAELQVVQQLTVVERSPDRLVVSAPGASNDPILIWVPSSPFTLTFGQSQTVQIIARLALIWVVACVAAWVTLRLLATARPVWAAMEHARVSIVAFGAANPSTAICIAALLATVLATYPVLFAGRSFASPNNGGTVMLYDQPPFLPGAQDFAIEDLRGTDVGAMMWQSVAHARVEREALAMGEVPLWNRYTALGRPLWGQGLSYILDPLQWLTFLGPDPAPGWDLKFLAHRFLFSFGVGLASLAATGAWLPAAVVAAVAPFAGAFDYRFNHPAIFSLTYAPWALLGWFLLASAQTPRSRVLATITMAIATSLLLVAPTPKEGALAVIGISAIGALAVLLSAGSSRSLLPRVVAAAVGGAAVVLLTAPHWLVFLDTMRSSAHAYESVNVITAGLNSALGLMVSPIMPGTPQPGLHLFALVLAVAAITAPLRMWGHRPSVACAIGATALIGLALGVVPAAWLAKIPLIAQIGHLYDVLLMAALTPLLIVCATGATILWSASTSRTVVVTVTMLAVAWWLLTAMSRIGPLDRFEPWAIALLLPLTVVWPVCLLLARRGSHAAAAGAVVAALVLVLPGGLHLHSGALVIDRILLQPRPRPLLTQTSPAIDAIHAAMAGPTRTTGVGPALFAGTHVLYGFEDLRGADPLEVAAYRELLDASTMLRPWYWLTAFGMPDLPRLNPVLDMLNVGFLIANANAISPGTAVLPMKGPDLVRAIQRSTPWPRAFFVDGANTYKSASDLVQQVSARRAPFAAILEGDTRATDAIVDLPRTAGRVVPADDYVLTANTTTFRVRTDREGIAVLGETFLPDDFVATLNGRQVPYFRVNHVFKAVRIPGPGEWAVRFEYRPKHWHLALALAASGALLLAAFAAVAGRRRAVGEARRRVDDQSVNPAARASS